MIHLYTETVYTILADRENPIFFSGASLDRYSNTLGKALPPRVVDNTKQSPWFVLLVGCLMGFFTLFFFEILSYWLFVSLTSVFYFCFLL